MPPSPPSRRRIAAPSAGLLALCLGALLPAAGSVAATAEELADFDAQVEYAFYTEDLRALQRLTAGHAAFAASTQPLERYQAAHAAFRLAQVARARRDPKQLEAAAGACLAGAEKLVEAEPRSAEALVLESACAGYLGAQGGLFAGSSQRRSEARLAAARELAPRNPRVLLLDALARWYQGEPASAAARGELRRAFEAAAAAFQSPVGAAPGEPSWGEAEAWLYLGRALEADGDGLGARNAYEKSLLVAPEFAAARRRIAKLRGAP
ncbi:MAG: hypothetical protein JSR73_10465 [Proteobacteria bacterium]|nr:hypothetical protein [Pseudomonadota bacterium]